MISDDIKNQIAHIQLVTRKTLTGISSGAIRTRLKGTGFEFDQLREYQQSDDLRFIDWNSSLRTHNLLVKSYFEERDRTIMIIFDNSASMQYGSGEQSKLAIGAQLAATLMYAGMLSNDKIGFAVMGQDKVQYHPPVYGQQAALALMETALNTSLSERSDVIEQSLHIVLERIKKGTMLFIISDFIDDQSYVDLLSWVSQKHDAIAVRCLDALEQSCDLDAYISLQDPETNEDLLVNIAEYNAVLQSRFAGQTAQFNQMGVDLLDIMPQRPFITDMIQFFYQRLRS